jgi:hypothetical protein
MPDLALNGLVVAATDSNEPMGIFSRLLVLTKKSDSKKVAIVAYDEHHERAVGLADPMGGRFYGNGVLTALEEQFCGGVK